MFIRKLILTVMIFGSFSANAKSAAYFTADGLEPDKWASIWLMQRYIDPAARIDVRPRWASGGGGGVALDIPGADLYRKDGKITFQVVAEEFAVNAPVVDHIGKVIVDIEKNAWRKNVYPETQVIEASYRALQERLGRENVSFDCYLVFFDAVATWVDGARQDLVLLEDSLTSATGDCQSTGSDSVSDQRDTAVPTVQLQKILELYASGGKVVFVDTREPEEYLEGHIPGAIHLPLRDLSDFPAELKDADMVVSYCVKDFRGYEVASDLLRNGVKNSVLMKPYGIKGWLSSGLPVESGELGDATAEKRLMECAADYSQCS